jgi:hypothetical protein
VLYLGEAQAGALGLEAVATGWRAEVAGVGVPLIGWRHPRRAGLGAGGAEIPAAVLHGRCGGEEREQRRKRRC